MKTYTLKEIKTLCSLATKGPWYFHTEEETPFYGGPKKEVVIIRNGNQWDYENNDLKFKQYAFHYGCRIAQMNAQFIAASRTIVPQLVGQLEKTLEALKYYFDKFDDEYGTEYYLEPEDKKHRKTLKELGVE